MTQLQRIRRGLRNPNLFLREANRLYHRRLNRRSFNTDGHDFLSEDWDNLFILDACRYDVFESEHDLPGELETRISRGSTTMEFLLGNFADRELYDTVYVTANPQLNRYRNRIEPELHAVVDVWDEGGWSEKHSTVLPETMTEFVLEAAEKYPDKRIIGHYIQPHYPFIDSDTEFDKGHLEDPDDELNLWNRLMVGDLDVSKDIIWKQYRRNLQIALPYIRDALLSIKGKSVVTADHGNMLGDRATPFPIREWGHPRGLYTEPLVHVPWLVYENGSRREITSEEMVSSDKKSSQVVEERLEDLGYL